MQRVALYTGSFDPVTNGHIDVIKAGAALCDRLIVAIGLHPGKNPIFTPQERADLIIETCTSHVARLNCALEVETFDGLAVDAARAHGATMILRGLRDSTDFDYEMTMAGMNAAMAPEIQTIFIPASPATRSLTATLVRQIGAMGGDVSPFAPAAVVNALRLKARR